MNDKNILASWQKNVAPWIKAIEERQIESRHLITDRAIVDAVMATGGSTVLDMGCGEGWLARELSGHGLKVTGIDAVEALVEKARQLGGGQFLPLAYEQLSPQSLPQQYDIAVCNFSLLGKESVEQVFRVAGAILTAQGHFIVQTLHPHTACGSLPYQDGWRQGSWEGFSEEFTDPAPWYFRTLGSWFDLFTRNHLRVTQIEEPLHPTIGKPASLLMVGSSR